MIILRILMILPIHCMYNHIDYTIILILPLFKLGVRNLPENEVGCRYDYEHLDPRDSLGLQPLDVPLERRIQTSRMNPWRGEYRHLE